MGAESAGIPSARAGGRRRWDVGARSERVLRQPGQLVASARRTASAPCRARWADLGKPWSRWTVCLPGFAIPAAINSWCATAEARCSRSAAARAPSLSIRSTRNLPSEPAGGMKPAADTFSQRRGDADAGYTGSRGASPPRPPAAAVREVAAQAASERSSSHVESAIPTAPMRVSGFGARCAPGGEGLDGGDRLADDEHVDARPCAP